MERSPQPEKAAIVPKPNLFERLIGWLIEQIVKLIWRVLVRPVLVAAFSPLLMVIGLAKQSNGTRRSSMNEETNPAGPDEGNLASDQATRDSEGRKDHG